MSGHTSLVGQRADQFFISDYPHTNYFDDGVPVLRESGCSWGKVIVKCIEFTTLRCPNCLEVGHYDENSNLFCDNCGRILKDISIPRNDDGDVILSDPKSAGRVNKKD